jgi:nucleoside-diphosphate kinase
LLWEGHGGKIIDRILTEGFEISALKLVHLTQQTAEEFMEVYKGVVPEYHVSHIVGLLSGSSGNDL